MTQVLVLGGLYRGAAVAPFLLDERPVTNAEFEAFVTEHPEWRRDRVPELFADRGYLAHWAGPVDAGDSSRARPGQPVTRVSWFAARAMCDARGARLPTEAEWEVAARASETEVDASEDAAFQEALLDWYARPTPTLLADAGSGPPNAWGARDLHGLVWEWVEDFGASLIVSDNRQEGDPSRAFFCAGAALAGADRDDYATFMRVAYRSSLRASYAVPNLGFRCASEAP